MTHEIHTSIDRIIRPGALMMGAFLMAAMTDVTLAGAERRRREDQAQLISREGTGDLSIIALVGNGASGRHYAKQLGPHLEEYGSTHFVAYPENGFSSESVAERILEAADRDKDRRKALFVSSMGEMVFNHLAADPEFAERLNPVDFLISNDGVTNISNLQPKMQRLIKMGVHLPVTKTTSALYSYIRKSGIHFAIPHEPEVSDDEVLEHLFSTASTPLYAMSAQWKNMMKYERLADGTLREFGRSILHKVHLTAPNDSVINGDASYRDKLALYGDFERVTDHAMPAGGHALVAEFPSSIRRILDRSVANDHENFELIAA